VALTRARDRLVICGRTAANRGPEKGCWYEHCLAGFDALETRPMTGEDGATFLRYGVDPATAARVAEGGVGHRLPDWARRAAPPEHPSAAYAAPSQLAAQRRKAAPSPLAETQGLGRYRRGDLIHGLLQTLPDLPPEGRGAAAERMLARQRDLTPEQRVEMAAAALGVLEDERFAEVFGPGSKPEVAVAGTAPELPAGLMVSGRVDRLVVTPERVLVVDFKTNRPSPERIEDADDAYLAQMAVYVAVLRSVFPGRRVEAALVWTDGPRLMPVPEELVAGDAGAAAGRALIRLVAAPT
jgi:ATP-dependent helicase/nuclease subunit A